MFPFLEINHFFGPNIMVGNWTIVFLPQAWGKTVLLYMS